eukprot:196060-Rhodomonas_salina.2
MSAITCATASAAPPSGTCSHTHSRISQQSHQPTGVCVNRCMSQQWHREQAHQQRGVAAKSRISGEAHE